MASQRIRFEVLARDGFRCQYCGAESTDEGVRLEVDHIYPRGRGGSDDKSNLITACTPCNRGKSALILERLPQGAPTPEPVVAEAPPAPRKPPRPRHIPALIVERPRSPHPRKRLRQVPWSDEVFTPDQLAIIASVQNRGKAA